MSKVIALKIFSGLYHRLGCSFICAYCCCIHLVDALQTIINDSLQMKQRLFLTIFLFIAAVSFVEAQNMAITMKDGTGKAIGLSSLEKVTFSTASLLINQVSGATESYSLSKIRKIYFESVPTGIESETLDGSSQKISFFPNPVENDLNFRNIPDGNYTLKIYRMDGSMVLQSRISTDNNSLDVSALNKGFYILTINNQVSKFIKQ